jgi:hypothetical protein
MFGRFLAASLALFLVPACGGSRSAPPPIATTPAPSASAPAPVDAGVDAAVAHPFAKTGAEASELIDKAVDSRHDALKKCIDEARARRNDPHAKMVLELGIDQEGVLIGVKAPKGALADQALFTCAKDALRDAPFPRSHAGVVTVRKTFEDVWVNPK